MDKNSYRKELEQLLSEDIASVKRREKTALDDSLASFGKSVVLFGAGQLGRKTLRGLRQAGIEPLAFADNNSSAWGKTIDGLTVLSPKDAAAKYGDSAAFIVTIWGGQGTDSMKARRQPLIDLGCKRVLNFGVVFWKFPEIYLPHYAMDLPHKVVEQAADVLRAFDLWEDVASQKEYVAQIRWRLHLDFDVLPRPVKHEIYFPDDLVDVTNEEVFVDCGAFDGDTVQSFLRARGESFGRICAFEADPANFKKLGDYVATLPKNVQDKISLYELAVGECRCKVRFDSTGTASSAVGTGSLEIDCVPLDEVLTDCNPTWIKMDIEGSEPDALKGARRLIETNTPVLAICVYHLQNHVWSIPLLMRTMSEEYRFFLRPHVPECWDLVCYAIPTGRLKTQS